MQLRSRDLARSQEMMAMAPSRAEDRTEGGGSRTLSTIDDADPGSPAWQRRVVDRSLGKATQRSLDRGAELIAAAARLLEQSNGDDFSVQDVADAAKQSLRSLYVHFEGKDDLLLAVFEVGMENYAQLIRETIEVYEDPLPRLVAAMYFAVRISEATPRGATIGLARLRSKLLESSPKKLAAAHAPVTRLFSQLLRDAEQAGTISSPHPEVAAFLVLTLRESLPLSRLHGNEYGLELPTVVELVEFTLHGLDAKLPDGWEQPLAQRWDVLPRRVTEPRISGPSSM
jgi:AcrR family transcriptional regulator